MSKKVKLQKQSDHTVTNDADEAVIFVDLDDERTAGGTTRAGGLSLARLCIVQGGKKVHVWVSMTAVGFDLDAKRGFDLRLYAAKNGNPTERKINIRMKRDGFDVEE
jgi:hypothetical protein